VLNTVMLNTVIVAVDGTKFSQQIVGTLASLKISAQGKIILSHVILPPDDLAAADRPHNPEILSVPEAEAVLAAYQTQLPYACTLEVVTGDPAIELVRLAHIYHADLIVMGNRGLTGLKRIIEGSVSSQVLTEAPCSVLVVKASLS
jgi:nucleotide-binding universal stress UspA family protein